jgi:hypothetical protein
MDPVSLATSIAILAAMKTVQSTVDGQIGEAGWALGQKILDKARGVFGRNEDNEAVALLEAVEVAELPSEEQNTALVATLVEHLTPAKKAQAELGELIAQAESDEVLGPLLRSEGAERMAAGIQVNQTVIGTENKTFGVVQGDVNLGG